MNRACLIVGGLAIALLAAACSREQTRVVENPRAPKEEARDYKDMLERVRNRQGPIEIQQALENAIRHFQRDMARLPTNLIELVHRRYLRELKPAPTGYVYSYDPISGNVGFAPINPIGAAYNTLGPPTNETRIQLDEPALPPPP